jgi:hypothetical protein
MRKGIVFFIIAFTSCVETVNLSAVDYHFLFNDANSKVWIVNKVILNDENVAPFNDLDKDLMVFHKSHVIDIIPLKDIMRTSPRKGSYNLDSKEKTLSIQFRDKDEWSFNLEYITEDSILMIPRHASQLQYSIQLKPFPEL